jgi:hypothetical protein
MFGAVILAQVLLTWSFALRTATPTAQLNNLAVARAVRS